MKLIRMAFIALAFVAMPLWAAGTVDINHAGADKLAEALQNVGPVKAEAIVEYRDQHGAFKSVEELAKVKGIGLATIEHNRDAMRVGSDEATGTN